MVSILILGIALTLMDDIHVPILFVSTKSTLSFLLSSLMLSPPW